LTTVFFWDIELCHRVFVSQCFETAETSLSRVSGPLGCLTIEPWRWGHCMVSKFWAAGSRDEAQYPKRMEFSTTPC